MKIGRVIGKVVSTRKEGNLHGLKILIVDYLDDKLKGTGKSAACVDTINAGEGDVVLLCSSSSARMTPRTKHVATDNTIVGIIDSVTSGSKYLFQKNGGGN